MFNKQRLEEIKESITKQDIRDLTRDGAIMVEPIKGRRTHVKRKTRRRLGSVRKKVNKNKKEYMIITRKLRAFVSELRKKEILTFEEYWQLRKEIRARTLKSKAHMKERINHMIKERKQ